MGLTDIILEAVIGIFIIFIFLIFVFPALGEATGQSVIIPIITLVILLIGLIVVVAIAIVDAFRGGGDGII